MQYFVMCMFVLRMCVCDSVCGHLQWALGESPLHYLMCLLVLQASSKVSEDARMCWLAAIELAVILTARAVFDVYRLQVIQVPSWTPKVWWLIRCLGSFQYCMFTCWCGDFSSFRVCSSLLNSSLYSALTPAVELGKNLCCAICVLGVGLFWAIQINEDNQHIFSKTPARDTHEIDI